MQDEIGLDITFESEGVESFDQLSKNIEVVDKNLQKVEENAKKAVELLNEKLGDVKQFKSAITGLRKEFEEVKSFSGNVVDSISEKLNKVVDDKIDTFQQKLATTLNTSVNKAVEVFQNRIEEVAKEAGKNVKSGPVIDEKVGSRIVQSYGKLGHRVVRIQSSINQLNADIRNLSTRVDALAQRGPTEVKDVKIGGLGVISNKVDIVNNNINSMAQGIKHTIELIRISDKNIQDTGRIVSEVWRKVSNLNVNINPLDISNAVINGIKAYFERPLASRGQPLQVGVTSSKLGKQATSTTPPQNVNINVKAQTIKEQQPPQSKKDRGGEDPLIKKLLSSVKLPGGIHYGEGNISTSNAYASVILKENEGKLEQARILVKKGLSSLEKVTAIVHELSHIKRFTSPLEQAAYKSIKAGKEDTPLVRKSEAATNIAAIIETAPVYRKASQAAQKKYEKMFQEAFSFSGGFKISDKLTKSVLNEVKSVKSLQEAYDKVIQKLQNKRTKLYKEVSGYFGNIGIKDTHKAVQEIVNELKIAQGIASKNEPVIRFMGKGRSNTILDLFPQLADYGKKGKTSIEDINLRGGLKLDEDVIKKIKGGDKAAYSKTITPSTVLLGGGTEVFERLAELGVGGGVLNKDLIKILDKLNTETDENKVINEVSKYFQRKINAGKEFIENIEYTSSLLVELFKKVHTAVKREGGVSPTRKAFFGGKGEKFQVILNSLLGTLADVDKLSNLTELTKLSEKIMNYNPLSTRLVVETDIGGNIEGEGLESTLDRIRENTVGIIEDNKGVARRVSEESKEEFFKDVNSLALTKKVLNQGFTTSQIGSSKNTYILNKKGNIDFGVLWERYVKYLQKKYPHLPVSARAYSRRKLIPYKMTDSPEAFLDFFKLSPTEKDQEFAGVEFTPDVYRKIFENLPYLTGDKEKDTKLLSGKEKDYAEDFYKLTELVGNRYGAPVSVVNTLRAYKDLRKEFSPNELKFIRENLESFITFNGIPGGISFEGTKEEIEKRLTERVPGIERFSKIASKAASSKVFKKFIESAKEAYSAIYAFSPSDVYVRRFMGASAGKAKSENEREPLINKKSFDRILKKIVDPVKKYIQDESTRFLEFKNKSFEKGNKEKAEIYRERLAAINSVLRVIDLEPERILKRVPELYDIERGQYKYEVFKSLKEGRIEIEPIVEYLKEYVDNIIKRNLSLRKRLLRDKKDYTLEKTLRGTDLDRIFALSQGAQLPSDIAFESIKGELAGRGSKAGTVVQDILEALGIGNLTETSLGTDLLYKPTQRPLAAFLGLLHGGYLKPLGMAKGMGEGALVKIDEELQKFLTEKTGQYFIEGVREPVSLGDVYTQLTNKGLNRERLFSPNGIPFNPEDVTDKNTRFRISNLYGVPYVKELKKLGINGLITILDYLRKRTVKYYNQNIDKLGGISEEQSSEFSSMLQEASELFSENITPEGVLATGETIDGLVKKIRKFFSKYSENEVLKRLGFSDIFKLVGGEKVKDINKAYSKLSVELQAASTEARNSGEEEGIQSYWELVGKRTEEQGEDLIKVLNNLENIQNTNDEKYEKVKKYGQKLKEEAAKYVKAVDFITNRIGEQDIAGKMVPSVYTNVSSEFLGSSKTLKEFGFDIPGFSKEKGFEVLPGKGRITYEKYLKRLSVLIDYLNYETEKALKRHNELRSKKNITEEENLEAGRLHNYITELEYRKNIFTNLYEKYSAKSEKDLKKGIGPSIRKKIIEEEQAAFSFMNYYDLFNTLFEEGRKGPEAEKYTEDVKDVLIKFAERFTPQKAESKLVKFPGQKLLGNVKDFSEHFLNIKNLQDNINKELAETKKEYIPLLQETRRLRSKDFTKYKDYAKYRREAFSNKIKQLKKLKAVVNKQINSPALKKLKAFLEEPATAAKLFIGKGEKGAKKLITERFRLVSQDIEKEGTYLHGLYRNFVENRNNLNKAVEDVEKQKEVLLSKREDIFNTLDQADALKWQEETREEGKALEQHIRENEVPKLIEEFDKLTDLHEKYKYVRSNYIKAAADFRQGIIDKINIYADSVEGEVEDVDLEGTVAKWASYLDKFKAIKEINPAEYSKKMLKEEELTRKKAKKIKVEKEKKEQKINENIKSLENLYKVIASGVFSTGGTFIEKGYVFNPPEKATTYLDYLTGVVPLREKKLVKKFKNNVADWPFHEDIKIVGKKIQDIVETYAKEVYGGDITKAISDFEKRIKNPEQFKELYKKVTGNEYEPELYKKYGKGFGNLPISEAKRLVQRLSITPGLVKGAFEAYSRYKLDTLKNEELQRKTTVTDEGMWGPLPEHVKPDEEPLVTNISEATKTVQQAATGGGTRGISKEVADLLSFSEEAVKEAMIGRKRLIGVFKKVASEIFPDINWSEEVLRLMSKGKGGKKQPTTLLDILTNPNRGGNTYLKQIAHSTANLRSWLQKIWNVGRSTRTLVSEIKSQLGKIDIGKTIKNATVASRNAATIVKKGTKVKDDVKVISMSENERFQNISKNDAEKVIENKKKQRKTQQTEDDIVLLKKRVDEEGGVIDSLFKHLRLVDDAFDQMAGVVRKLMSNLRAYKPGTAEHTQAKQAIERLITDSIFGIKSPLSKQKIVMGPNGPEMREERVGVIQTQGFLSKITPELLNPFPEDEELTYAKRLAYIIDTINIREKERLRLKRKIISDLGLEIKAEGDINKIVTARNAEEFSKSAKYRIQKYLEKTGTEPEAIVTYTSRGKLNEALRLAKKARQEELKAETAASRLVKGVMNRVFLYGGLSMALFSVMYRTRQAIQYMSQFEVAVVNVTKVMNPLYADMGRVSRAAREFGKTYGYSILQAANTMTIFAQQGKNMNQIIELTKASMLATNTTLLQGAEATEALTAAIRQFRVADDQAIRLLDIWNELENKTAITSQTLATSVKQAGTAARVSGMSFEEFNAIIAAVGSATRQTGSELGRAFKFILSHLRREDAVKALQNVGVAVYNQNGVFRDSFSILSDLAKKWGSLTNVQKQAVSMAIAGTRRFNTMLVLMERWGDVLDNIDIALKAQGSSVKENKMVMATLDKIYSQLTARIGGFVAKVGESGATGILKNFSQVLSGVIDTIEKFPVLKNILGPLGAIGLTGGMAAGAVGFMNFSGLGSYFTSKNRERLYTKVAKETFNKEFAYLIGAKGKPMAYRAINREPWIEQTTKFAVEKLERIKGIRLSGQEKIDIEKAINTVIKERVELESSSVAVLSQYKGKLSGIFRTYAAFNEMLKRHVVAIASMSFALQAIGTSMADKNSPTGRSFMGDILNAAGTVGINAILFGTSAAAGTEWGLGKLSGFFEKRAALSSGTKAAESFTKMSRALGNPKVKTAIAALTFLTATLATSAPIFKDIGYRIRQITVGAEEDVKKTTEQAAERAKLLDTTISKYERIRKLEEKGLATQEELAKKRELEQVLATLAPQMFSVRGAATITPTAQYSVKYGKQAADIYSQLQMISGTRALTSVKGGWFGEETSYAYLYKTINDINKSIEKAQAAIEILDRTTKAKDLSYFKERGKLIDELKSLFAEREKYSKQYVNLIAGSLKQVLTPLLIGARKELRQAISTEENIKISPYTKRLVQILSEIIQRERKQQETFTLKTLATLYREGLFGNMELPGGNKFVKTAEETGLFSFAYRTKEGYRARTVNLITGETVFETDTIKFKEGTFDEIRGKLEEAVKEGVSTLSKQKNFLLMSPGVSKIAFHYDYASLKKVYTAIRTVFGALVNRFETLSQRIDTVAGLLQKGFRVPSKDIEEIEYRLGVICNTYKDIRYLTGEVGNNITEQLERIKNSVNSIENLRSSISEMSHDIQKGNVSLAAQVEHLFKIAELREKIRKARAKDVEILMSAQNPELITGAQEAGMRSPYTSVMERIDNVLKVIGTSYTQIVTEVSKRNLPREEREEAIKKALIDALITAEIIMAKDLGKLVKTFEGNYKKIIDKSFNLLKEQRGLLSSKAQIEIGKLAGKQEIITPKDVLKVVGSLGKGGVPGLEEINILQGLAKSIIFLLNRQLKNAPAEQVEAIRQNIKNFESILKVLGKLEKDYRTLPAVFSNWLKKNISVLTENKLGTGGLVYKGTTLENYKELQRLEAEREVYVEQLETVRKMKGYEQDRRNIEEEIRQIDLKREAINRKIHADLVNTVRQARYRRATFEVNRLLGTTNTLASQKALIDPIVNRLKDTFVLVEQAILKNGTTNQKVIKNFETLVSSFRDKLEEVELQANPSYIKNLALASAQEKAALAKVIEMRRAGKDIYEIFSDTGLKMLAKTSPLLSEYLQRMAQQETSQRLAEASDKLVDSTSSIYDKLVEIVNHIKTSSKSDEALKKRLLKVLKVGKEKTEKEASFTRGIIKKTKLEDEVPHLATGGLVKKPTIALIGEQGEEIVIPIKELQKGKSNIDKSTNVIGYVLGGMAPFALGKSLKGDHPNITKSIQDFTRKIKQKYNKTFYTIDFNVNKYGENVSKSIRDFTQKVEERYNKTFHIVDFDVNKYGENVSKSIRDFTQKVEERYNKTFHIVDFDVNKYTKNVTTSIESFKKRLIDKYSKGFLEIDHTISQKYTTEVEKAIKNFTGRIAQSNFKGQIFNNFVKLSAKDITRLRGIQAFNILKEVIKPELINEDYFKKIFSLNKNNVYTGNYVNRAFMRQYPIIEVRRNIKESLYNKELRSANVIEPIEKLRDFTRKQRYSIEAFNRAKKEAQRLYEPWRKFSPIKYRGDIAKEWLKRNENVLMSNAEFVGKPHLSTTPKEPLLLPAPSSETVPFRLTGKGKVYDISQFRVVSNLEDLSKIISKRFIESGTERYSAFKNLQLRFNTPQEMSSNPHIAGLSQVLKKGGKITGGIIKINKNLTDLEKLLAFAHETSHLARANSPFERAGILKSFTPGSKLFKLNELANEVYTIRETFPIYQSLSSKGKKAYIEHFTSGHFRSKAWKEFVKDYIGHLGKRGILFDNRLLGKVLIEEGFKNNINKVVDLIDNDIQKFFWKGPYLKDNSIYKDIRFDDRMFRHPVKEIGEALQKEKNLLPKNISRKTKVTKYFSSLSNTLIGKGKSLWADSFRLRRYNGNVLPPSLNYLKGDWKARFEKVFNRPTGIAPLLFAPIAGYTLYQRHKEDKILDELTSKKYWEKHVPSDLKDKAKEKFIENQVRQYQALKDNPMRTFGDILDISMLSHGGIKAVDYTTKFLSKFKNLKNIKGIRGLRALRASKGFRLVDKILGKIVAPLNLAMGAYELYETKKYGDKLTVPEKVLRYISGASSVLYGGGALASGLGALVGSGALATVGGISLALGGGGYLGSLGLSAGLGGIGHIFDKRKDISGKLGGLAELTPLMWRGGLESESVLDRTISKNNITEQLIGSVNAVKRQRKRLIKLIKSIKDKGLRNQAQKVFKDIPYKSLYTIDDLKKLGYKKILKEYDNTSVINKRYTTSKTIYDFYRQIENSIKKILKEREQRGQQTDISKGLVGKFKKDVVRFTSKYGSKLDVGGFLKHIREKYLDILEKKERGGSLTQKEINKFTKPVYNFMKSFDMEEIVIPDEKTMSNIINEFDSFPNIKMRKKITKKPLKNKYDTILQKKIFELGKRFKGTEINLNKYMSEVLKGKFNLSDFTFTKAGPKRNFKDFTLRRDKVFGYTLKESPKMNFMEYVYSVKSLIEKYKDKITDPTKYERINQILDQAITITSGNKYFTDKGPISSGKIPSVENVFKDVSEKKGKEGESLREFHIGIVNKVGRELSKKKKDTFDNTVDSYRRKYRNIINLFKSGDITIPEAYKEFKYLYRKYRKKGYDFESVKNTVKLFKEAAQEVKRYGGSRLLRQDYLRRFKKGEGDFWGEEAFQRDVEFLKEERINKKKEKDRKAIEEGFNLLSGKNIEEGKQKETDKISDELKQRRKQRIKIDKQKEEEKNIIKDRRVPVVKAEDQGTKYTGQPIDSDCCQKIIEAIDKLTVIVEKISEGVNVNHQGEVDLALDEDSKVLLDEIKAVVNQNVRESLEKQKGLKQGEIIKPKTRT
ncbi:MAG: phage tail tape measure protein [Candidatus Njordarchaeia archaeon]